MQNRLLGVFLCLTVLLSSISTFFVVSASEMEYDSIADIMGGEVETVSGLDFQFAHGFDDSINYVTTPEGASYGANGLDLTKVTASAGQASWRYKPNNGWAPFSYGDAIFLRAKANSNGGYLNVQFFHDDDNGGMFRYYMNISETIFSVSNVLGSPAGEFTYTPGSDWANYLIKKNDDNGFSVYINAPSTQNQWKHYITIAGDSWKGSSSNGIGIAVIGAYADNTATGGYVEELAVLKKSSADIKQSAAIYVEEFEVLPEYRNYEISNGQIFNGELVLGGNDNSAEYTLKEAEIPKGGYALMCVKSNVASQIIVDDGNKMVSVSPKDYGIASTREYVTWMIRKNSDGTFSGMYRKEGDFLWHTVFETETGTTSSGEKRISFLTDAPNAGNSSGTFVVDRFEIYAPEVTGQFVITDGAGGRILKLGALPKMLDSVTVTIKPDKEVNRTMVMGIYGENGVLADSLVKEIPAGDKPVMVVCNTKKKIQNVRKIRTFLWDGFDKASPVAPAVTTNGNASAWTDIWNTTGTAYAEYDALVLDSEEGKQGAAVLEADIGSSYDLSWDMRIEQFGDRETVQVDNGVDRICFHVKEDGIFCPTTTGDIFLPWVITSAEHHYRLIGDGTRYLLYIDGYFVGEISGVAKSDEIEKISFSNQGNSLMRIDRVFLGSYSEANVPDQGFYDDFEVDSCGWTLLNPTFNNGVVGEFWKVEDGNLKVADEHIALDYTTYCVSYGYKPITEIGDEFFIQTKVAFPSFGTRSYMTVYVGGRCICVDMREKFFSFKPVSGSSQVEIAVKSSDELSLSDSQYHILTMESYNHMKNVRLYLDGELILDGETEAYTGSNNEIRFMMDGGWLLPASLNIDYIKYVPKTYDLKLTAPVNQASYSVGEDITVSATEEAEFILNGIHVATGTTITLSDLPSGVYQLEARKGEKTSDIVQFTVSEIVDAKVQSVVDGSDLTVSLDAISDFDSVASVVYLLDGKKVAESKEAPYCVEVSNVETENHRVEAVCFNAAGREVGRFGKEIIMPLVDKTIAYSYDVSYTASGNGTIEVKNGNHQLQMNHKTTGLRYLTDDGVKSYIDGSGLGDFRVLTDGPIAEVYKNGQFILSFFMPKTTEVATEVSGSVSNYKIDIPKERKNYFSEANLNVKNTVYELFDMEHNHNLDFVANASDEAHITLNDGYFRNDITLQDGKLYVWTAERNNSDPKLTEVAELALEDVYYRIETSGGMSRLYGDGRWITTFRNANVAGRKGTLAVHVSKGDGLSYLAVNSNADLYYYYDTFDDSGDIASLDYWTTIGGKMELNTNEETMIFEAEDKNAIAEINAYVGNATLSADITVDESAEGVWFISNHGVSKAYTKAGFNFLTNAYEILNVNEETETIVATKPGVFSKGTAARLSLACSETTDGKKVTLFVDGQEMISSGGVINTRGTIGFAVSNGSVSVDNVDFRGDAKPMLDVRTTVLENAPNALDMIETEEKTYLVTQSQTGYYTTDGGKKWNEFTLSANAGFGSSGYGGMSKNMVQLKNGEIIAMHRNSPSAWTDSYGQRKSNYQAYVSTDGGQGMTWYKPGNANFPENGQLSGAVVGRDATVNRVTQGPSGRVYFVYGEGNSEDYGDAIVWMSDDEGKNWFQSQTRASALDTGFVIAEAVVIETTKSTRLYFRTDKGQLCYFVSNDRGITWNLTPHMTPFISSMTCFGLEADPEDPDTLYIAWGYDNINFFARAQFPRTRWAVAKSSDGGDSWEMIGTAHENTGVLTQGMNRSLNVAKDYVYLNGATADSYGSQNDGYNRIIAFPKDKQRTSLRMEQLHLQNMNHIENARLVTEIQSGLCMAANFDDGSIVIGNQRLEDVAKDGYVSLDVAASFAGASAVRFNSDGSIVFVIGGHNVTLFDCDIKRISDINYIKLTCFAEKMGLNQYEISGLTVVTTEQNLSRRQCNAIRYAADLFSNHP